VNTKTYFKRSMKLLFFVVHWIRLDIRKKL